MRRVVGHASGRQRRKRSAAAAEGQEAEQRHRRLQRVCILLAPAALAGFLQGCGGGADVNCDNSVKGWTSKNGRTCEDYYDFEWCTSDGDYGSGWDASANGDFEDWANPKTGLTAVDACCGCGGGVMPAPAPAPPPTTATGTETATTTSSETATTTSSEPASAVAAATSESEAAEQDSEGMSSATVIGIVVGSVVLCLLCWLTVAFVAVTGLSQTGIKSLPARSQRVQPGQNTARSQRVQPGQNRQTSGAVDLEGYSLRPVEGADELKLLRELFNVTDTQNLGIGRDVVERMKYKDLSLHGAWRIVTPDKETVYNAKKTICASEIRRASQSMRIPPVKTKLDAVAKKLGLDAGVNEKLLLHGTKPGSVIPILQNGLNERFSGGLFGSGIYLAEDPSKIDQYCAADTGDAGGDDHVEHLHKKLYTNGKPHPGGKIFYCFGVRVPCGIAIHTKDGETDMADGKSIWATPDKRELVSVPGVMPAFPHHCLIAEAKDHPDYKVKRQREFVTFNGDMTLLDYLIAYSRVPKSEPSSTE